MHLSIQDNGIALSKYHIAVGDQGFVLAFDQDDHGLAGNVQIPDALTVPWIVFLQHNFLEVDVLAVLKRFCPKYNGIIRIQYRIAARNEDFLVPFDHGYDHFLRESKLGDRLSDLRIMFF